MSDGTCLVAVSGGADSVALLSGLSLLRSERRLHVVVAHFNHRLRGDASAADAVWVRKLAESLGLPAHVGAAGDSDVARPKEGLEAYARRLRYRFLAEVSRAVDADWTATGHTADDQAETVLHHFLRGSWLGGLAGISPIRTWEGRGLLARPLLRVQRHDGCRFLEERHQAWRTDESNTDVSLTRNRLRHELMPLLMSGWNPQLSASLCALGDRFRELQTYLDEEAGRLLARSRLESPPAEIRLDLRVLQTAPPLVIRQALVLEWSRREWPRGEMSAAHWERLAGLLTSDDRHKRTLQFPHGMRLLRRGMVCVIYRDEPASSP